MPHRPQETTPEAASRGTADTRVTGLPQATPDEIQKTEAIEAEKQAYKANFDALRGLKTQIEHIQRLLEHGRVRMQTDFDQWYKHVVHRAGPEYHAGAPEEPPARPAWGTPPAEPKAGVEEDVAAFYRAKEELGQLYKR